VAGNSGSSHSHNDIINQTGSIISGGAAGIGLNMGIGSSLGHLGASNAMGGSVSGSVAGNSNANSSNL